MTTHGHVAEVTRRQCHRQAFLHNQDPIRTLATYFCGDAKHPSRPPVW
jgi:hypothetical protein